ncbi:hypothetical protein [Paenibacillus puerhi]|uniref:hypothetical protein n=1 Tax=Paenibacillus puerhi TaxID=2692622 RepID=UPI00135C7ED7|nr:hypothetical protein [Paenibacillus puerhi]
MLYFCNLSDHFWGYRIFNNGQEVGYLRISYEIEEEIVIKTFEGRYPDKDILELYGELHEEISKEVRENGILEDEAKHIFDKSNVSAFKLFNISDEQIEELKSVLKLVIRDKARKSRRRWRLRRNLLEISMALATLSNTTFTYRRLMAPRSARSIREGVESGGHICEPKWRSHPA